MATNETPAAVVGAQGPAPVVIPASAYSRLGTETNFAPSKLVIGTNSLALGQQITTQLYWFVVVDLNNKLNVVANQTSTDPTVVPPQIQQYANKSQYFLFVISNGTYAPMVPQGALATFLANVGAGAQLAQLEQIIEQIGTGIVVRFSYILAATMDFGDLPGFEALSEFTPAILTMGFLPVYVGGQTIYAPIRTSASTA